MANMNFGVNIIPKANNTYTLGNSDYKWNIYANTLNGISLANMITDVQINGTSILNNHIATIPIANANTLGVVSNGGMGIGINSSGSLYLNYATDNLIKAGTSVYNAITAGYQHQATFYGLAKAAGDSTQSASSNAVGNYTSGAKTAIQNMLAVAPTASPVFTGSISLGRYYDSEYPSSEDNTIGTNSIVVGTENAAVGDNSQAFGYNNYTSGFGAMVHGRNSAANGTASHAEGIHTWVTSNAWASHAEGCATIADNGCMHVSGQYNVDENISTAPTWVANTQYKVGDKISHILDGETTAYIYSCITANNDATFDYTKWKCLDEVGDFVEIVGNGGYLNGGEYDEVRSNARALDWSGNEYLNGYLYVGCNANSGGGIRVPHDIQINNTSIVSNGIATIPIATANDYSGYRLVQIKGSNGINIASDNCLSIVRANESDAKAGSNAYRVCTPFWQHYYTFYGLAKAAGDSTQSASDNAVGVYTNNAKTKIGEMLGIVPMVGATSSVAGTGGLVPAPTTTDVDKFLAGDGTYKSGGLPMVILSYGNSTWNDFINAYNNNVIVYCRASSNSNPATGSQTRMAFMAYVSDATNPTNVEFQYYRSMNSHSATAMGDEVYVYKLTNASGGTWSVTTRPASIKEIKAGTNEKIGVSWSSNVVTLTNTMTANDMPMSSSDSTTVKDAIDALSNQNAANVDVKTTNNANADLDITDVNGNVILRLQNGHIQTKSFNSVNAITQNDLSDLNRVRTRMKFGAHNGAEYYAPECTIPAYRIAGQQGWDHAWIAGIDFSTDGTMYVIHDDTVDRTTNGTGYLNEMSDTAINALTITQTGEGYNLSDFSSSELIIPTLEQVIQQCVKYGMKMVLRLSLFPKEYDTAANQAKWDNLVELLTAYNIPAEDISCYVSVLGQATISRTLIDSNVEISTFLGNSAVASDYITWFNDRSITGKRAAIINYDNLDLAAVKLLHSNGIRVYTYKYNPSASEIISAASMGIDVFQNGKVYKMIE